jgi:hypothetical protein
MMTRWSESPIENQDMVSTKTYFVMFRFEGANPSSNLIKPPGARKTKPIRKIVDYYDPKMPTSLPSLGAKFWCHPPPGS